MLKKTLPALTLSLLLLLGTYAVQSATGRIRSREPNQRTSKAPAGTFQKMIVQSGSVTMNVDLNGLNGDSSLVARPITLQFVVAANSFLPILVFNDLLRGAEPGSMALIPSGVSSVEAAVAAAPMSGSEATSASGGPLKSRSAGVGDPGYSLPEAFDASLRQLVVEKLPSNQPFDLAVRDGNTGFTFFNVEGDQYNYDAKAQSLSITGGRLLISKEFANALGIPSNTGAVVGRISVGAAMQPIEMDQLDENGNVKSATLPALNQPGVGTVPGPDVIVGDVSGLVQSDTGSVGGRVGLALGTDACNKGTVDVGWFQLPSNNHPFIPQNLYRMSGGADNTQKFEQIGQSWGKHAFFAASSNDCNFGCNGINGDHLGSGCSDFYSAGLNGSQTGIGSRAWVNPFTGSFVGSIANDHSGHVHDATSHRILIDVDDLNTSLNVGATYFAEAEYIVPDEGTWCQSNPDQCNMYNNASYKQYTVNGINPPFSFSPVGSTVREQPAIMAWTGATVNEGEPDPGNDGIFFVGYKVTGPNAGVYHYEYAIYNQNLDRAIQSFEVVYPLFPPIILNNIGFHAPPQHPGFAHDGTLGDAGYSSTPWTFTKSFTSATWNCETFVENQNANAIRFGTLYNFRFDSSAPPADSTANIGFFKAGSPISVQIQAPAQSDATPTATPSPPPPTPTATPTATATATPTPTVTPTPTPRPIPTPRPGRPTPHPRPTPH